MMKNRAIAILVILAVAGTFVLSSACSAEGAVALLASPTPSTAPTATPTAMPSPTIGQEEIDKAQANQNIQAFLEKTDAYSDEATQDRYMTYKGENILMGWKGEWETTIEFQGEFFGYVASGDYLVIAVGFNGTDGKNHVKPIAIPIEFFRYSDGKTDKFPFQFHKLGEWSLLTSHKLTYETNLMGVKERLRKIEGNPIILLLSTNITSDDIEQKGVGRFGEKSRCYFEELQETSALFSGLMSEVVVKANEEIVLQKTEYPIKSDTTIPDIVCLDDLETIDISVIPRVFGIASNLW